MRKNIYLDKRKRIIVLRVAAEDDVGSHLQKNTADSFSLAKNKVPTLNKCSLCFHLFYTTTLRSQPESFESLSSMAKK